MTNSPSLPQFPEASQEAPRSPSLATSVSVTLNRQTGTVPVNCTEVATSISSGAGGLQQSSIRIQSGISDDSSGISLLELAVEQAPYTLAVHFHSSDNSIVRTATHHISTITRVDYESPVDYANKFLSERLTLTTTQEPHPQKV